MQREWKYLSCSDGDNKKHTEIKARRAYLPGGKHWKGRSPLEEERTMCDQLFQDTFSWLELPFLMLDFFKALGSLVAWISACRATESTHALTLPSEPPPSYPGVEATRMRAQRRELPVQIQVKMHFYIFYCKCQSSHFLYSVLILYVK